MARYRVRHGKLYSPGLAKLSFVQAPHRLHQQLLRPELQRVGGDLGVQLHQEFDVLFRHEQVGSILRRQLAVGRVHDATRFDEHQPVPGRTRKRQTIAARIHGLDEDQIRERQLSGVSRQRHVFPTLPNPKCTGGNHIRVRVSVVLSSLTN